MSTQNSNDNPASPKASSSFSIASLITFPVQSNDTLFYDAHAINNTTTSLDCIDSNRTSPSSTQSIPNEVATEPNWYHRGSLHSPKHRSTHINNMTTTTNNENKLKVMEGSVCQFSN
jgi:hypothetical protein